MTAPATTSQRVRVWVTPVWDTITLDVGPDWTVHDVKNAALRGATARTVDSNAYVVKFRGAEVFDEGTTLDALGVPDGAPMIVLPARRQPAR